MRSMEKVFDASTFLPMLAELWCVDVVQMLMEHGTVANEINGEGL